MSTQIAQLYAKIGADTAGFEKGMKSSHTALASFSTALGTGLVAAAALGVAAIAGVAAIVVKGVKSNAQFEQGMADIAAVMGKTRDEVGPLGKMISDLALDPTLKVNATEAAEAVMQLAKMGISMGDMLEGVTKQVVLFSNATGADMATSAEIGVKVMKLWKIAAEDMGNVTNQTLGVLQQSSATANDYNLALARGGGALAAYGVSQEDFNAMLALTIHGFSGGAEAGTGLKRMYEGLNPMTNKAADEMRRVGLFSGATAKEVEDAQEEIKKMREQLVLLNPTAAGYALKSLMLTEQIKQLEGVTQEGTNAFYDQNGVLKDSATIFQILQDTYKDMTPLQRDQSMATIWSTDAIVALNAAMEIGADGVVDMKEKIGNTDAEEAAATRMATLIGQWEIFTGVLDENVKLIGSKFDPALMVVVKWLNEMADKYLPSVVEWFGVFGDWLSKIIPGVLAFIETTVAKFGTATQAFMEWATGGKDSMGVMASASEMMGEAVRGAFGWLVKYVRTNLPVWVETLGEWGAAAGDWITDVGWPKLKEKLPIWWGNLVNWVQTNYPIWVAKLQEWGEAAGDWITETGWPKLKENLPIWAGNLWEWLKTNLPIFIGHLVEWAVQLGAWVIQGIAFLISNLANGVDKVSNWLSGTGRGKVEGGVLSWVGPMWEWVMTELWPKLEPALEMLGKAILKIIGATARLLWEAFWAIPRTLVNAFTDAMEQEWNKFTNWWTTLWYDFKELIHWDEVRSWSVSVIKYYRDGLDSGWGSFSNWWLKQWDEFKALIKWDSIKKWGADVASRFMQGNETTWDPFVLWWMHIWDDFVASVSDIWGIFKDFAADVIQGFKDGINERWDGFKHWWKDLWMIFVENVNGIFGIHSPSTVFYGIGTNIVQGMANGLVDTMPIIDRVMAGMAKTVTTVVAGMYDQINAATAEIALRASYAGIAAGEMANVHNDLITQNDANSTGLGANWTWADLNARDETLDVNRATTQGTSQGTSITIENVNLGGSGNSAQDILQAVNFINSTYSYGY